MGTLVLLKRRELVDVDSQIKESFRVGYLNEFYLRARLRNLWASEISSFSELIKEYKWTWAGLTPMGIGYERKPSCRLEAHNHSELAISKG